MLLVDGGRIEGVTVGVVLVSRSSEGIDVDVVLVVIVVTMASEVSLDARVEVEVEVVDVGDAAVLVDVLVLPENNVSTAVNDDVLMKDGTCRTWRKCREYPCGGPRWSLGAMKQKKIAQQKQKTED